MSDLKDILNSVGTLYVEKIKFLQEIADLKKEIEELKKENQTLKDNHRQLMDQTSPNMDFRGRDTIRL